MANSTIAALVILAVILLVTAPLPAAQDDIVVEGALATNVNEHQQLMQMRMMNQGEFNAAQHIDSWVFQNVGNATMARMRFNAQLSLQLDEIQRVCNISAAQKEKLQLAARGDMARLFDEVAALHQKFSGTIDQQKINEVHQATQPLQKKVMTGIFGSDSFFAKTVKVTLTPQQAEKMKSIGEERRRFAYSASIDTALAILSNVVAMDEKQHTTLKKLLLEETEPSLRRSQYDFQLIMFRLSKLDEAKVKSLFNEVQWKALKQQLDSHRGYESMLKQQGVIAP
ncbi:MAG: hypothetical protein SGJ20_14595 [Planctomycetota bacterium]|nr:hypothetical protein [Planctomycetota bacterium]